MVHTVLRIIVIVAFASSTLKAQVLEWAHSMGGTESDNGLAIAVDDSGNVYTTGFFDGVANFGGFTLATSSFRDIFIQKINANGITLWAKKVGGYGHDVGYDIAVDDSGNVYTTGYFSTGVDFDPGPEGMFLFGRM